MLANIQLKKNDKVGYVNTIENWLPTIRRPSTGPTC
jgi:hypothetical protein